MFDITWMSILSGLSNVIQESVFVEVVRCALQGFKMSIHIASIFDMELEIRAFFSTIVKFTSLKNIPQMKGKHFDAIKTILEVAAQDGNVLGESWRDVFSCIVQLDKIQTPDLLSVEDKMKPSSNIIPNSQSNNFLEFAIQEIRSQEMTTAIDKIFTNSVKLNAAAILCFVKSLCESSWAEISESVDKEKPRMLCLQRLVEISYYNMKRIRVEWSSMWAILGEHFNHGMHRYNCSWMLS